MKDPFIFIMNYQYWRSKFPQGNLALNLSKTLGRGEAYAIALSLEIKADLLLINDREVKEAAESKGIKTKRKIFNIG
ncbi:MAG: hypothetical protein ACTSXH_10540 [Promethearchaeota archaeon]